MELGVEVFQLSLEGGQKQPPGDPWDPGSRPRVAILFSGVWVKGGVQVEVFGGGQEGGAVLSAAPGLAREILVDGAVAMGMERA